MNVSMKAKRQAVAAVFGDQALDDDSHVNFLYQRRRCSVVQDGRFRDLEYVKEWDELESAIRETLDRIAKRDGKRYAAEVAESLVESLRN